MTHSAAIYIIKSHGKRNTEQFDRAKLHHSIQAACLSVRSHEGDAKDTADKVCAAVIQWLDIKSEVTSDDIRRIASKHLTRYHPDAAYMYANYRHTI